MKNKHIRSNLDDYMKKSIFKKKMEDPKFKVVYEDITVKLSIGERIAELRHSGNMLQEKNRL